MPYMDPKRFLRHLRKNPSNAERYMWRLLRARRFCGYRFRRQRPIGPYIVDFCCPKERLVIELDGGQHNEPEKKEYDAARTEFLNAMGYRVIRFWDNVVFSATEDVLLTIYKQLNSGAPLFPRSGER